jgi:galactokinase
MSVDFELLKAKFIELYKNEPRIFRAPGRVNLIGEHTDYNGGFVLPMAINREAAIAIAKSTEENQNARKLRFHTINLDQSAEIDLNAPAIKKTGSWTNFIEGVARLLVERNVPISSADFVILSDVPSGGGLSSSAALEVSVGLALTEISGTTIDRTTLALIGQETEHEFVGAKVGIMDQFVSANASSGHALLLDCRSLEYEHVPLDTSQTAVVICNTNVKHDLATSEYNVRRSECERGVQILKQFLPSISELRDVSIVDFERYADRLPEIVRQRCRHVVTEIARTLEAADALRKNDLINFGKLMWESHNSLRDDYEVSSAELDLLVEIANRSEGVLGARMTGGGFGGSTVNLVHRENLDSFTDKITIEYTQRIGFEPTIYVSEAADGASEVEFQ